jgi:hypothetical protein
MVCPHCSKSVGNQNRCVHCGRKLQLRLADAPEGAVTPTAASEQNAKTGNWPTRKWLIAGSAGLCAMFLTPLFLTISSSAHSGPKSVESNARQKSEADLAAVKNSSLQSRPNTPIAKVLEQGFSNYEWTSGETAKGLKYVEFTGRNIEAYKSLQQESKATARFRFVLADDGKTSKIQDLQWPLFDLWTNPAELAVSYIYKQ